MCGIVGVRTSWLGRRTSEHRVGIDAALEALRWRGRDGSNTVTTGDWQVGVARLVIADPSADQPIVDRGSGDVVAFNGALTNAAEDRARFGSRLRTGNDAEILLVRHATAGVAGLRGIHGHYAFAVIAPDGRCSLGRDPEGEKPLFLVQQDGRLVAFASTIAALRALGVPIVLADEERAQILRYGFGSAHLGVRVAERWANPVDRHIEVVCAAPGLLEFGPGGQPRASSPTDQTKDAARSRPFELALRDAARRCADAEVPVGLSLSGGIDSGCIAACLHGRGLRSYSFQALGEPTVERERAQAVASQTGHTLVPVDAGPEILRQLPVLTRDHGMPLGDPSVLASHALGRVAHQDGVRVLLSGEGSDELLLGYQRHRLARFLPLRGSRVFAWLAHAPSHGTAARAWNAIFCRTSPYDSLLEVVPRRFATSVFTQPFADLWRRTQLPPLPLDPTTTRALQHAHARDRRDYLRCDLLPKLDVATLAAGVEGRCPFLDPLVTTSTELLAATSSAPALRRLVGKRLLREAFAASLPAGFFDQPKTGFAIPLDRWILEDDFLCDLLRDSRTRCRSHLDAAGLARAIDRHRNGRARFGHALYLVAAVELYDRTLDG